MTLLTVEGLGVRFGSAAAPPVVRDVSFSLDRGECLAVVGESGSGKSVTARSLVGLTGPRSVVTARRLEFDGTDLGTLGEAGWRGVRGRRIGLVLQDALTSLDPLHTVGAEVAEPLRVHGLAPRAERSSLAAALLGRAGVPEPERRAAQYPHQLSGGLRQRALIASALAGAPDLLIADEPTTALDVTVQAQVLELLAELRRAGTALLLISHDLSVVARTADRVAVMYGGRIVESGPTARLLADPRHPYTRALLAAVPGPATRGRRLAVPVLDRPGPTADGCPYAARCDRADRTCLEALPAIDHHGTRCWHPVLERPATAPGGRPDGPSAEPVPAGGVLAAVAVAGHGVSASVDARVEAVGSSAAVDSVSAEPVGGGVVRSSGPVPAGGVLAAVAVAGLGVSASVDARVEAAGSSAAVDSVSAEPVGGGVVRSSESVPAGGVLASVAVAGQGVSASSDGGSAVARSAPAASRAAEVTLTERPAGLPAAAPGRADGASAARSALIEVDQVTKSFGGRPVVRGVSLTLAAGETLGLVGESGSGKTTVARMVLGLERPDSGTVRLGGGPWSELPERRRRAQRLRLQAVPQDPLGSFDPRHTVERVIGAAVARSGVARGRARRERTAELLDQVGLPAALLTRRPAELSGGQRQRVAIARALAPAPEVLVCDEPVSALDVSVQAQILDLMGDLREHLGLAMLFISHDLGVVHHLADRVAVMTDGQLVETGEVTDVFTNPAAGYTRRLLAAVTTLEVPA
ncbi:dipeptide ABC transporter ATP-binding protein [Kitasatospora sp. NPDC096147]|uniref:dipeptide ABC transporter ATP-binding protein n=1 Tax=Kitasatospora sp. NPDC096147 TaxID=3364093 RepID=UPI0037F4865C